MSTIATAQREYYKRPADERFASLTDLVTNAQHEKNLSAERTYPIGGLSVRVADGVDLELVNANGQGARFSHWSFGQLARMAGAPAAYLRDGLSPTIAADALNYGLRALDQDKPAQLLLRAPNGKPQPTVRAITTEAYSRLWDVDLYRPVLDNLQGRDARWQLPPTWTGEPGGAYRGDRDSFLILCNGGSIVADPSLMNARATGDGANGGDGDTGTMYRALLIRNSEVGASSVWIEEIYYRYICGNHLLWGAVMDRQSKRRHVGKHLTRDVIQEITRVAFTWANRSASQDEAIVRSLITHEIASDVDQVVSTLRSWGATEDQALAAYRVCVEKEPQLSPRSFWGIAQGLTRESQQATNQDERYQLDRLAGLVLARGSKLVTA